jgi:hypothetical protein
MIKLTAEQIKAMEDFIEADGECEIRGYYNNKVWKADFYEFIEKFRTYEEALIYSYMMIKVSADKVILTQDSDNIIGYMYDSVLGCLINEVTAFYSFNDGENFPWGVYNTYSDCESIKDGEEGRKFRGINNSKDFKEYFELLSDGVVDWNKLEQESSLIVTKSKITNNWVESYKMYWKKDSKEFIHLNDYISFDITE